MDRRDCFVIIVYNIRSSALTFRDFVCRLKLLTLFREFKDFWKRMKLCEMKYSSLICKSYLVVFLTFITGTPILSCSTTDLGIFGVEFVRALIRREIKLCCLFQNTRIRKLEWQRLIRSALLLSTYGTRGPCNDSETMSRCLM